MEVLSCDLLIVVDPQLIVVTPVLLVVVSELAGTAMPGVRLQEKTSAAAKRDGFTSS